MRRPPRALDRLRSPFMAMEQFGDCEVDGRGRMHTVPMMLMVNGQMRIDWVESNVQLFDGLFVGWQPACRLLAGPLAWVAACGQWQSVIGSECDCSRKWSRGMSEAGPSE